MQGAEALKFSSQRINHNTTQFLNELRYAGGELALPRQVLWCFCD